MVCVLARGGKPLMPTNIRRARRLLRKGRAVIAGHHPFTIRLLDREDGETQPIEYKCDTGDHHIGISICTEKQEIVSAQYDLLSGEPERHRDRASLRRNRRCRLRHRKPRFDNRRKPEGWLPPTLQHKRDQHVLLYARYAKVLPVTDIVLEMGGFDTQVLAALEAGRPLPEGTGYQHGPRYGYDTLREAVFTRDRYTCQVCGKGAADGAILRMHHLGFRAGDRSNRMGNLLTVCTKCHTAKNHKAGGRLWDLKPKLRSLASAAHMSSFRWSLYRKLKQMTGPDVQIHVTYGAATKGARRRLQIPKSHAGDAYAMGTFHPKKRARTERFQKCRRNNRILEKFYDARYVDLRDGGIKSGSQLSCGRTNRSEPRKGEKNERTFRARRAEKRLKTSRVTVSRGRRSIRRSRSPYRPGDSVWISGKRHTVHSAHCGGSRLLLEDGRSVAISRVQKVVHTGGWRLL